MNSYWLPVDYYTLDQYSSGHFQSPKDRIHEENGHQQLPHSEGLDGSKTIVRIHIRLFFSVS